MAYTRIVNEDGTQVLTSETDVAATAAGVIRIDRKENGSFVAYVGGVEVAREVDSTKTLGHLFRVMPPL